LRSSSTVRSVEEEKGMNCPNGDLLSAFFDGEVEPPWAERIRKHIEECERCRKEVGRLEMLSRLLQADEEPGFEEHLERTRAGLAQDPRAKLRKPSFWRARIRIPAPAAAAVLLLVLGLGGLLVYLGTKPSFPFMSIRRAPSGVTEVQVAAPVENLEQLLKSLDRQLVNQEIIFNLPEDTTFIMIGEPKMLRAEDLGRGTRW
jgi:hypothetical protein